MDDLERILARDDGIEPSAGFADAVQAGIEASHVQPLPFPWGLWALGLLACTALAAAGAALWPAVSASARAALVPFTGLGGPLGYAAAGVVLSLVLGRLPHLLRRS
jgi:hypothetical protein